ncbi:signal peptidase I [Hamadaea tsunoensis]|uniref:signal peptidase I n=1 Tax=Hamadaea tsunoensis TaxID=53368 RepID=UPI0003F564AD|nr:signal peptidase I [Hamadaea tsunoensis]
MLPLLLVVLSCAVALPVAARLLLILTIVDGPSMEPALRSGERVLVRRTRRPRRGDVVLMRLPADGALLLKRVVAVAGDHLPAGWAAPDLHGLGDARVPGGSYVVLGDNSAVSTDSRYFGLVARDRLVGVMIRRLHAMKNQNFDGPQ